MIGPGVIIIVNSKIFIVEDQMILANDLKLQLEKLGYVVVGIAGNEKKLLKKLEKQNLI
jgi:CheY-like chemotaxis protein